MPQVSTQEFERLPLRVHDFLGGVPLHDVWAVDLQRTHPGITLNQFLESTDNGPCSLSPVVRILLFIRVFVGKIFGWDREWANSAAETFATRLTAADHSRSLVTPGTRDGFFRVIYRFENEQLLEVINRTVHAAALSALVETPTAYRYYFGIYVRSVGRFTSLYMLLIDPFSKTYRLSIPPAHRQCQLESSIQSTLVSYMIKLGGRQ